ncbi:MAG: enoyl-CoA hydratase/isomerase family protein [Bradyrhizobiaceae bacterium]|nr:enoyl-CoA hydratase/isomerase family protein [Bradyrhizobiaceae bacterium]
MSSVHYDVEGCVATARIDRADRLNALSGEVQARLTEAFAAADSAPGVRALIVTGTGRAFSVGADIDELATDPEGAARQLHASLTFLSSPERMRKPVIAAVNGYALGGGLELSLACDFVLASEKAVFGVPEPTLGVVPGMAMQRLPKIVGIMRAREILLTARRLSATEAHAYGLVTRVVPHEKLMDEARALAQDVARLGPHAVELLKATINRNFQGDDLLYAERANAWLFATRDAAEGIRAFREKRAPNFGGLSA